MTDPSRSNPNADNLRRNAHRAGDDDAADRALWRQASQPGSAAAPLADKDLMIIAAFIDGSVDDSTRSAAEALLARSAEARAILRAARLSIATTEAFTDASIPASMIDRALALNPVREAAAAQPRRTADRERSTESILTTIRDWLVPAGGWGLAAAASLAVCFIGFQLGGGGHGSGSSATPASGSDDLIADFSLGYFEDGWAEEDEAPLYWNFDVNGEGSA
jgi:hypothetical protein